MIHTYTGKRSVEDTTRVAIERCHPLTSWGMYGWYDFLLPNTPWKKGIGWRVYTPPFDSSSLIECTGLGSLFRSLSIMIITNNKLLCIHKDASRAIVILNHVNILWSNCLLCLYFYSDYSVTGTRIGSVYLSSRCNIFLRSRHQYSSYRRNGFVLGKPLRYL